MKKIRNYFVLMMVALMSVASFTSCNGDDDDDPESPASNSKIVGTWRCVHEKYIYKENGKVVEEYDGPYEGLLLYEFTSKGILIMTESGDAEMATYTLSGDKLTITNDEGDTGVVYVKKLNKNNLEFEITDKGTYQDGTTYEDYDYVKFERIK